MNLYNILNDIAASDPEVFEKTSERRNVIKNLSRNVALTALPFALGSTFKKAYGKTTDVVLDTLNFALTLEYLEAEFYATALSASTLTIPTAAARNAIQTIANHEAAHVAFLVSAITAAGGKAVAKPKFDFTGGKGSGSGPFAAAFSDYNFFLAVAQTLEDTGVRAYKGQAGNLMTSNAVLEAALNIHSVEARHAAHIRYMRMNAGGDVRPWITLNENGIGLPAVQPSYNGEDVTTQAGINIVGINGLAINAERASEAFDEILTKDQVLMIVDPFIVP